MPTDENSGIEFGARQVNGSYWPIYLTGREVVGRIFGDDVGAPIKYLTTTAKTTDVKTVSVTFRNDDPTDVVAEIE